MREHYSINIGYSIINEDGKISGNFDGYAEKFTPEDFWVNIGDVTDVWLDLTPGEFSERLLTNLTNFKKEVEDNAKIKIG